MNAQSSKVLIALPEATVARLMSIRAAQDEALADVIGRLASDSQKPAVGVSKSSVKTGLGRYQLKILGEEFVEDSLADVLTTTLNCLAELDVEILEKIEKLGGRKRKHVSRDRDRIYPDRPDLSRNRVTEFRPGWWHATNYSLIDVQRILKDICGVCGIRFGKDLVLES